MWKLSMVILVVSSAFLLHSAQQRRNEVNQLIAYGASSKKDAALVADFAACLGQRSFVLPLQAAECGAVVATRHGPDATFRIDVIHKNLAQR